MRLRKLTFALWFWSCFFAWQRLDAALPLQAGACVKASPYHLIFGAQVDANGCLLVAGAPLAEVLPEGFVEVFGPRPVGDLAMIVTWEQNLRLYRAGPPVHVTAEAVAKAAPTLEAWGLHGGRYFRLADQCIAQFDNGYRTGCELAIYVPHLAVAIYQQQEINSGRRPSPLHPFLDHDGAIRVQHGR